MIAGHSFIAIIHRTRVKASSERVRGDVTLRDKERASMRRNLMLSRGDGKRAV